MKPMLWKLFSVGGHLSAVGGLLNCHGMPPPMGGIIFLAVMNCFSSLCAEGFPPEGDGGPRKRSREGSSKLQDLRPYSHKELKTATNNFSSSNKVGDGAFGSVFKGKLRDGSVVGIKVLSAQSSQGDREFEAEIESMSNATHENLLKLRGFCAHGNFRALVYDYMENKSLAQTLLGDGSERSKFNWKTRRDILLGIAGGLAYLHEGMNPHVVHRDIKASNILLDTDLTAKISDFGLAKFFPDSVTHISTRVAGTLGYLAPEYATRGQLTRKADVYSFGVLALEVISGKRSTDSFKKDKSEPALVAKAWELYNSGELEIMVDETLAGDFPVEEAGEFMKVSLLCVQGNPRLRPAMSTVIKMMNKETPIGDVQITEPGLIRELSDLKVRSNAASKSLWSSSATVGSSSTQSISGRIPKHVIQDKEDIVNGSNDQPHPEG